MVNFDGFFCIAPIKMLNFGMVDGIALLQFLNHHEEIGKSSLIELWLGHGFKLAKCSSHNYRKGAPSYKLVYHHISEYPYIVILVITVINIINRLS